MGKSTRKKVDNRRGSSHSARKVEKCLICNATLPKILRNEAEKTVLDKIDSSISNDQKEADILVENLCSIFYLSFKVKDVIKKSADGIDERCTRPLDFDFDGTGTQKKNCALLEPCTSTSLCCSICQAFVEEFFKNEKQINDLIRQMSRLKQRIGSLMVETFPVTSARVNNYTLKKRIYEAWFPKVHDPPTVPAYQPHYKFLKDVEVPLLPVSPPSAVSATSQSSFKENGMENPTMTELSSQIDEIVLNPSLSNQPDQPLEWNLDFENVIAMEYCSPGPSPLTRMDSERSEDIGNERAEGQETPTTVLVDDDIDSTKLRTNSERIPVEDPIKAVEQVGENGITDEAKSRREEKLKSFTCPHCSKSLTNKISLLVHVRGHTGETPYSCKYCEKKFRGTHQKRKHERFACKLRPELQTFEDDMEDPEPSLTTISDETNPRDDTTPAATEVRIKNYACPHCEVGQHDTMLQLKDHIKEKHPGENLFKCGWCDKSFRDNSNTLKHERYACRFRPFRPEDPHSTSKKKSQLMKAKAAEDKLSRKIESGIKIYECPHCEVQHDKMGTLKTHIIESHPGQLPFICGWCGKSFGDQSNVLKHEKTHFGPQHQCEICGKQFHYKHGLLSHRIFVHEKRPYTKKLPKPTKCKICERPCNSVNQAKRHEKTHAPNLVHERIFQYKCPECPKHLGFGSKMALYRHYKQTHPDLPIPNDYNKKRKRFPCPECPPEMATSFSYEAAVIRHIQIYHTGSNPPPYLKHRKKALKYFEIDSNDSGTENSDGTTSESEVEEGTTTNRSNKIGNSRKMKTRQDSVVESTPSAEPHSSSSPRQENSSSSSESESYDSDEANAVRNANKVILRTRKKRKQKGSVKKTNSNPLELKRLRIHLTRIDEDDSILADKILLKEEASEMQIKDEEVEEVEVTEIVSTSSFIIGNVYSLAE